MITMNKEKLEQFITENNISEESIYGAINFPISSLIKDKKPIPANVSSKLVRFFSNELGLDGTYLIEESDSVESDVERKTPNPYGAAWKSEKMSTEFVDNNISVAFINSKIEELDYTNISLSMLLKHTDKQLIARIKNRNRKYLSIEEANNLAHLLRCDKCNLSIGGRIDKIAEWTNGVDHKYKFNSSELDDAINLSDNKAKSKFMHYLHIPEIIFDEICKGDILITRTFCEYINDILVNKMNVCKPFSKLFIDRETYMVEMKRKAVNIPSSNRFKDVESIDKTSKLPQIIGSFKYPDNYNKNNIINAMENMNYEELIKLSELASKMAEYKKALSEFKM